MKKINRRVQHLERLIVFALFGAIMFFCAQIDIIPNFHPLALFIVSFTVVYRSQALIPIYVFVLIEGLLGGFNPWWYPYLYVWTVLWGMTMLIPKRIPEWLAGVLMIAVSGLHGILFGVLYAPFQCYFMHGGDWNLTLTWLISGIPFDTVHLIGNVTSTILALPFIRLLSMLSHTEYPFKTKKAK